MPGVGRIRRIVLRAGGGGLGGRHVSDTVRAGHDAVATVDARRRSATGFAEQFGNKGMVPTWLEAIEASEWLPGTGSNRRPSD